MKKQFLLVSLCCATFVIQASNQQSSMKSQPGGKESIWVAAYYAAQYPSEKHTNELQALVQKGGQKALKTKNKYGSTPLDTYTKQGGTDQEIIKLLTPQK